MHSAVAVLLAVGAAASFAMSAALQQAAARNAPANISLSWRLIAELVRHKTWLIGMGCVVFGFGLQAAALAFAPIALVEPIIATELLFAIPLARRLHRRPITIREWAGAAAVAGGVGLFLAVSSPKGGNSEPGLYEWAVVCLPVLAASVCAIAAARGPETPRRAALLATAAGLVFGVQALIAQSFVVLLRHGFATAMSSWQPYALACIGASGFVVAQSAYQSGPLAISLPIIDSLEPTVSVILAVLAFGQVLSISIASLGLECVGAVAALVGIVLLARSPLVLGIYQEDQQRKNREARLVGTGPLPMGQRSEPHRSDGVGICVSARVSGPASVGRCDVGPDPQGDM